MTCKITKNLKTQENYEEHIFKSHNNNLIRGATAPKSQDRLKWVLPDGSTGDLVVSKALIPQP